MSSNHMRRQPPKTNPERGGTWPSYLGRWRGILLVPEDLGMRRKARRYLAGERHLTLTYLAGERHLTLT
jgi:hypothetical protein